MTWLHTRSPSLLDTAGTFPVEWTLVYGDTDRGHWWNRWLEPRFRHVAAYRRDGRVWIEFAPTAEFVDVHLLRTDEEPWPRDAIVQRVVALRREGVIRSRMFVGPITCVEHVKALLGIRSWLIRTPFQLHRYCRRQLQCDDPRHQHRPRKRFRCAIGKLWNWLDSMTTRTRA